MAGRTVLRHFQYMWTSFLARLQIFLDYAVQTAGPLYVVLGVSLISTVTYLFYTIVLPSVYAIDSPQGVLQLVVSLWLLFNVFFNYILCIYTNPGTVPTHFEPSSDVTKYESGDSQIRWCKRCRKPKPAMTHHCHACRRCILKMDHHCPWMHNCIGFYNYRYFFLFLVYLWAGCVYTALMASVPLFRTSDPRSLSNDTELFSDLESGQVNGVMFTLVLALAVLGSLTCLLGWHIYLVGSAQTTIDFYANRQQRKEARRTGTVWVNEFDFGVRQNFSNLFDLNNWYSWVLFLLPSRRLPRGDGIHFPIRGSLNASSLSIDIHPPTHQTLYYHLSKPSGLASTSRSVATRDKAFADETSVSDVV